MKIAAAALALLALTLSSMALAKDELCTDGVDCYCDRVRDPADPFFDPNLLWCDDFEDPAYENSGAGTEGAGGGWTNVYGVGTSACRLFTPHEGAGAPCINILHDERSRDYDPSDPDFNCDKAGFDDCVFQGHQSFGEAIRNGARGGQSGEFPIPPSNSLSLTMAIRYDADWDCLSNWVTCKGDRLYGETAGGNPPQPLTPWHGGAGKLGKSKQVCRGPVDGGSQIPFAANIFNRTWCGASGSGAGIDGRCECAEDDCFSTASTRQGGECHREGSQRGRVFWFAPDPSDYQFGVPGGIPNSTEGDGDGHEEWMCIQWSIGGIKTQSGSYRFWVNGTQIMNFENLEFENVPTPKSYRWLSLINTDHDSHNQFTGKDFVRARDNFHLTASATPVSCKQVGFTFDGSSAPAPDPSDAPDPSELGAPGQPILVTP